MKSLLTDEIEVYIRKSEFGRRGYFWKIDNAHEFGFSSAVYCDNFKSSNSAELNFIATAKRNGWKRYRFI